MREVDVNQLTIAVNPELLFDEVFQGEVAMRRDNHRIDLFFQQHKRRLYTWTSPDGQYRNRLIIFFAAKNGEALYSQQKKVLLSKAQTKEPLDESERGE